MIAMKTRFFALVLGVMFLALGVLGFVPALLSPPGDGGAVAIDSTHGLLFGVLPVNAVGNLARLGLGVWGVVVWRGFVACRLYARVVALLCAVLAAMGVFPTLATLFGLMPIDGADVWLHAGIAMAAAYVGFLPVSMVEGLGRRAPG